MDRKGSVYYAGDSCPQIGPQLHTLRSSLLNNGRGDNRHGPDFKDYFTNLAKDRLPSTIGQRYADVVSFHMLDLLGRGQRRNRRGG